MIPYGSLGPRIGFDRSGPVRPALRAEKRRSWLWLALALIIVVLAPLAWGGEHPRVLAAYQYDDGANLNVGVAIPLPGPLWSITTGNVGKYGSVETDLALLLWLSPGLFTGPLAGPGVDFGGELSTGDVSFADYFILAGGYVAGYKISRKVSAWAFYRYKFAVDGDNLYQDGSTWGVGLSAEFSFFASPTSP